MFGLSRWFKRENRDGMPLPGAILDVATMDFETGELQYRKPCWQIEPVVAWYDCWVGIYVDRDKRTVYVFPCPCIGLRVYWG